MDDRNLNKEYVHIAVVNLKKNFLNECQLIFLNNLN